VLNALRQSEENHPSLAGFPARQEPCSTPYGNQRKITASAITCWACHRSCSTPYGNQRKITTLAHCQVRTWNRRAQRLTAIRGKSRRSGSTRGGGIGGAQRLTAIRGKSQPIVLPANSGRLVCSTPYGNQRKITLRDR